MKTKISVMLLVLTLIFALTLTACDPKIPDVDDIYGDDIISGDTGKDEGASEKEVLVFSAISETNETIWGVHK